MGGGPAKDHLLILLPQPEPKEAIANLQKAFPDLDITYHQVTYHTLQPPVLATALPDSIWHNITILYTVFTLPPTLSLAPHLQLVQLASAGSNQLQHHPLYTDTQIPITTSSGIHGPQIAEWVLMTALVQNHHYNALHDLQKQHKWGTSGGLSDKLRSVQDLVGKRLGVLGYGSIGRQVGRVAKAMGMEVVAYTATPKDTPEKRRDQGFIIPGTGDAEGSVPKEWYSGLDTPSLHHFLRQRIDWLVVSVPLTPATTHFLSTTEFSLLKGAFISNIARGPILDQPALITALKDGTLAGAALDVTDPEPLPRESELWDLENVVVTPHISGSGTAYLERSFGVLEENVRRLGRGEQLLNLVRRERGY